MESTTTPGAGAPTPASPRPAPSNSAAQNCTNCGARLTADQRYCVECGERRGEPRFSIADAVGKPASASPAPPRRRRPTLSANSSLIAGVATLLIAMGVGVLIGRTGRDSNVESASNQPVKVLSVPGSGAATTATAAAAGAGAKAKKAKSSSKKNDTVVNTQTSSAEGQPAEELPPSTVGIGDKGQGAGYKNGQFTGDFFGP